MIATCTHCKRSYNDYTCPYCFQSTSHFDDLEFKDNSNISLSRGWNKKEKPIDKEMAEKGIKLMLSSGIIARFGVSEEQQKKIQERFIKKHGELPDFKKERWINELKSNKKKK